MFASYGHALWFIVSSQPTLDIFFEPVALIFEAFTIAPASFSGILLAFIARKRFSPNRAALAISARARVRDLVLACIHCVIHPLSLLSE
jgi:hypothetical protein